MGHTRWLVYMLAFVPCKAESSAVVGRPRTDLCNTRRIAVRGVVDPDVANYFDKM